MASNYTGTYNLNQWAASDRVLRTEFNADNAKIDAALAELSSGKASVSALNSLKSTVDGLKTSKADKTALDSLKSTVTSHTSALSGKGNCQLYTTSYTGTGKWGRENPCSLTFPHKPMMVVVFPPEGTQMYLYQGQTKGLQSGSYFYTTWSGNSVSWYHVGSEMNQMNSSGTTYRVVAFLQAG